MSHTSESFLVKSAATCAIGVAGILILTKFYAWYATGALSVQASLLDSILDIMASMVNFFAVRQALKPADFHHRYGYGKVEALAGILQSILIFVSGLWLFKQAFHHISESHTITNADNATIVMIMSVVLTAILVIYQRYVVRRTKSIAIEADSLHYQTDLYTNLGVLVSLHITTFFDLPWIDPLVAIGIMGYIVTTSYQICVKSIDILLDRELPAPQRQQILEIVAKDGRVLSVHDLKTRSAGFYEFIQMHLDLNEELTLKEAHDITEEIELELLKIFPKAEILIHQDPAKFDNHGLVRNKSRVDSWIKHKKEWFADFEHSKTQFDEK
jgi:ferrous-iron efflux pump FieF